MAALSGWNFVLFPSVFPIVLISQEQAVSRGPKLRYLPVPWRSQHVWASVTSNYPRTQSSTEWCAHPYFVDTCVALFILQVSPLDKDMASKKGFCPCKGWLRDKAVPLSLDRTSVCPEDGSQYRLLLIVLYMHGSRIVRIVRKCRTPIVYMKHLDCCMLAQLKNKTSLGKPSGYQTFPRISLHPLLHTFNSTCHGPGRQLLIPESQHYLWFPLVALIKGKEGKKFFKAERAIWD